MWIRSCICVRSGETHLSSFNDDCLFAFSLSLYSHTHTHTHMHTIHYGEGKKSDNFHKRESNKKRFVFRRIPFLWISQWGDNMRKETCKGFYLSFKIVTIYGSVKQKIQEGNHCQFYKSFKALSIKLLYTFHKDLILEQCHASLFSHVQHSTHEAIVKCHGLKFLWVFYGNKKAIFNTQTDLSLFHHHHHHHRHICQLGYWKIFKYLIISDNFPTQWMT